MDDISKFFLCMIGDTNSSNACFIIEFNPLMSLGELADDSEVSHHLHIQEGVSLHGHTVPQTIRLK